MNQRDRNNLAMQMVLLTVGIIAAYYAFQPVPVILDDEPRQPVTWTTDTGLIPFPQEEPCPCSP